MKLYLNKTSPYGRLVMVVIHEKNLTDKVALAWSDPWESSAELLAVNPFSKVPALVTDGGRAIIESGCICDYLDDIGGGRRLLPLPGAERLAVMAKYGLGRALIDAAYSVTIDNRFHGSAHESALATRWTAGVRRALESMGSDTRFARLTELPDMGDLALAVGLSYVELRLAELEWRTTSPRLAKWLDQIAGRTSMRLSAPQ